MLHLSSPHATQMLPCQQIQQAIQFGSHGEAADYCANRRLAIVQWESYQHSHYVLLYVRPRA